MSDFNTAIMDEHSGDRITHIDVESYIKLKKERDELKGAVKKHFEANCNLDNYPNYNDADVELWKFFKMEVF